MLFQDEFLKTFCPHSQCERKVMHTLSMPTDEVFYVLHPTIAILPHNQCSDS